MCEAEGIVFVQSEFESDHEMVFAFVFKLGQTVQRRQSPRHIYFKKGIISEDSDILAHVL